MCVCGGGGDKRGPDAVGGGANDKERVNGGGERRCARLSAMHGDGIKKGPTIRKIKELFQFWWWWQVKIHEYKKFLPLLHVVGVNEVQAHFGGGVRRILLCTSVKNGGRVKAMSQRRVDSRWRGGGQIKANRRGGESIASSGANSMPHNMVDEKQTGPKFKALALAGKTALGRPPHGPYSS